MIKLKGLGIQQVIVLEYLKDNIRSYEDLEKLLIEGLYEYFKQTDDRIYNAYWSLTDKQTVEVMYFISQYLLKEKR